MGMGGRGGLQDKNARGETKDPIVKELNTMIKSVSQAESGAIRLAGVVYMTCQVMFGSGANWFDTRQNSKSLRGGSWKVNKERFLHITTRSDNTPSSQLVYLISMCDQV